MLLSRQLGSRAAALLGGRAAWGGGGLPAAAAVAGLHTSSPLLASLQVKIPALGESISDGTVSAVLKEAGQRVEEDEPILQIETDKVTVDVRAPRAGVIEAILVKPDENVVVGHVVASIAEGATAAASAPAPQQEQQQAAAPAAAAPPPPKPAAAKAPAAAAAAPAAAEEASHHRQPAIRFPPRRTPAGEQISAMPESTAKQMLAALLGGPAGGGGANGNGRGRGAPSADRAAIPDAYKHMIAVPIVGGSMPILRGMPVPSGPPGPPRRSITEAEMEAIMLGGADP